MKKHRRKRKQDDKMDDSWLLPYADMLTLLLALFIVLYASSEINEQKFFELRNIFNEHFAVSRGSSGVIENGGEGMEQSSSDGNTTETPDDNDEDIELSNENIEKYFSDIQYREFLQMQEQINLYISKHSLEEQLSIQLTDEGLLLTIVNDVLFDSGSAELKRESHATAQEISHLLHTEPPHQIVISGHADDVPINNSQYSSNWELSVERALNFMTLILQNDKLDPSLFSAKGYGENKPLYPNDTAENRAKNRRVEVLILPNIEVNEGT